MFTRQRGILRLLSMTLAIGCGAPAAGPAPAPASSVPASAVPMPEAVAYETTAGRLWAALPKAYKAVGITVNAEDEPTHTIGFSGTIRRELGGTRLSKYFRCGDQIGENADTYDIRLFIGSQVARDPNTDRIIVKTSVRVSARSAFGGTYTLCTSSGELERRLNAALRAEVQR